MSETTNRDQRAAEVFDLAVASLIASLNVTSHEATRYLVVAGGCRLTPPALTEATNQIRQLTKGAPHIG